METRQLKGALKAMPIRTDRAGMPKASHGCCRWAGSGRYTANRVSSQEMRALLTSRKSVQEALINMELSLRGILRNFGLKLGRISKGRYEARDRELIAGNAMLEAAAEPILRARADLRRELAGLEKLVRNLARQDLGVPAADDHAGGRPCHSSDLRRPRLTIRSGSAEIWNRMSAHGWG